MRAQDNRRAPTPLALALLLGALLASSVALAQPQPPIPKPPIPKPPAAPVAAATGFDAIDSCKALETDLKTVNTQSEALDAVFAEPAADTETFLKGIFAGTHTMLSYGEALFTATEKSEDKCKSALREAQKDAEIIRIYTLLLDPTLRGHAFLRRVKDSAAALKDTATVQEMDSALQGYTRSMEQLIGACESDLPKPEDQEKGPCADFRARIESATATAVPAPAPATP